MSDNPTIPVDLVNRALDECGVEPIGGLQDGSAASNAASRIYWPLVRQLLSAAPWNFARKQEALNLLGTQPVPNTVPTSLPQGNLVYQPWVFMYEIPVDCVHVRYIPANCFNVAQGITLAMPISGAWNSPAPFVITSYPLPNDGSNWDDIEGHDPDQTKVILTNVPNASAIYTGLMQYPNAWDPLFEQAFVWALAASLAMPCIKDRKEAMALRRENRLIAVEALNVARVRDGDEGWTVADHTPDWIRIRIGGYFGWQPPGWPQWNNMPWTEDAGGVY